MKNMLQLVAWIQIISLNFSFKVVKKQWKHLRIFARLPVGVVEDDRVDGGVEDGPVGCGRGGKPLRGRPKDVGPRSPGCGRHGQKDLVQIWVENRQERSGAWYRSGCGCFNSGGLYGFWCRNRLCWVFLLFGGRRRLFRGRLHTRFTGSVCFLTCIFNSLR